MWCTFSALGVRKRKAHTLYTSSKCLGLLISRRKNVVVEVCWENVFLTKNLNPSWKHLLLRKGINQQLYTEKYLTS